ncbi:hypothetical protein [Rhizobium leguminosarum]|nr:hypothetical protein [Rhizobium leguminosarum]
MATHLENRVGGQLEAKAPAGFAKVLLPLAYFPSVIAAYRT